MKGGFNIKPVKDKDFKYTINEQRKKWISHIYPFGEHLIPLFSKIPWKEYIYEGTFRGWYLSDDEEYTYNDIIINAKFNKDNAPYYYFGGVAYEILNAIYPCVDLHKFVDPTGDIDMILQIPYIHIDKNYDYVSYFFENEEKSYESLSPFILHYTDWVFQKVIEQFENIPLRYFNEIFGECEDIKTKNSLNTKNINNKILISRVFLIHANMIKIQGLCKFNNIKEDHFFEFIIPLSNLKDSPFINYKIASNLLELKDKIYINNLPLLIRGDMVALQTRIHAFDENINEKGYEHKFYNHIQRFQYLIHFIMECLLKENKLKIPIADINMIITSSLNIFVLYYLLKISNKLYLVDYTKLLTDKEILDSQLKDYYTILKRKHLLNEDYNPRNVSSNYKSFKKSQIIGVNINVKKNTNKKEPYLKYKDIYEELFPKSGGFKKTRKLRLY